MFSKALTLVVLAGVALAQTFSINTPPSIQQCQPAALSWTGGTGPFIIAAIPAGQVSAAAIATIAPSVTGSTYSWTVNLAQGTAITIKITDSQGNIAYSSSLTVQAGTSSACLTGSSSSSGAASGASSSGVAASASSVASGVASSASSVSSAVGSASSAVATSVSSVSSMVATSSSSSSVSRAASSTAAASSTGAGSAKASFNIPFLALAAALGCVAFGGFAILA